MKRFLKQMVGFTLFCILCASGYFAVNLYVWDEKDLIGSETYISIKKAKDAPAHVRNLIMGGSTGNQLFPNTLFNGLTYSLCCNQATSLAGQYILLHEFLFNHTDPSKLQVFLLLRPSSLRNDLDQRFVYNYFLKPFDHPEYQSHLSPYAQAQLKKVPLRRLAQIPFIRRSHWSPNLQQQHQPHKFRISNLSAEYLRKIHSLCKLNNVRSFKVRATYLSSDFGEEDLKSFRKDIVDQGLQGEMRGYFSTLATYPAELFMEDKVHLLNTNSARTDFMSKLRLN